eukprot:s1324_g13.t1
MFRRCLSCLLNEIYKFSAEEQRGSSDVFEMPRSTAQELVLASIFGLVAITDLSACYHDRLFATDASMSQGAVVSRPISEKTARVLWLGGDKKGGYSALDPPFRELRRAIGEDLDLASQSPKPSLEFRFDFVEICGGAASISKFLAGRGYRVMPPIELSDSPHFDICNLKLVEWLCDMLRSGRLNSLMAEPVCTTFSPAAHPAVRSYKEPLGFDRRNPKTLLGNCIAFRCLFLVWYAAVCECPSLAEQPRLSKMAWLSVWRFLLEFKGFSEAVVASCQFGSIHKKEFRLIGKSIDMEALERKCPGGHDHVRIEGQYTKPSAIYTEALAEHIGRAFEVALRRKRAREEAEIDVRGVESVLANDMLVSGDWELEFSWFWRRSSHINILESSAYVALLKKLTKQGGDIRFTTLLDSRVAKCSHAKGRSSSRALHPTLRKGAAWQFAGGLYPALGFSPTRLNTADSPSRGGEVEEQTSTSFADKISEDFAQKLHSLALSRVAASWIRLTILLSLLKTSESLSTSSCSASGSGDLWPWTWILAFLVNPVIGISHFVGGLAFALGLFLSNLLVGLILVIGFFLCLRWTCRLPFGFCFSQLVLCQLVASGITITPISTKVGKTTFHELQPLPLATFITFAEAMPMSAAGREELQRAERRAGVNLVAGRAVLSQTRSRREVLLEQFEQWLVQNAGMTLAVLVDSRYIDPEQVSEWLVRYGKELYYAGKAYGRFSETINGITARRPILKKQLASAWDLAFAWVCDEPHQSHPAMPLSVLLSFVTLSLLWGWPREAAILMMTWTGVMRVGEALLACRKDLVLPSDGTPGRSFALILIHQPKTRGVAARHQSARVDPSDAVQLLTAVFGRLGPSELLWNSSPSALRRRFAALQKALGLPTTRTKTSVPYDLASLRAGGATFLLHKFEDSEFVRRRGRWMSSRVCEASRGTLAIPITELRSRMKEELIRKMGEEPFEKAFNFLLDARLRSVPESTVKRDLEALVGRQVYKQHCFDLDQLVYQARSSG